MGKRLIGMRGEERDVRGVESGQTGGMERSGKPPGEAIPVEGDEARNSGERTPVLGNRIPRGQNPTGKDQEKKMFQGGVRNCGGRNGVGQINLGK